MSNMSGDDDGSFSSGEEVQQQKQGPLNNFAVGSASGPSAAASHQAVKKKRNPNAEVIALSPTTLMATNRFVCEICNKGFQRDQNLQLHRRGHNLPWKLKQRSATEVKKRVYICPEPTCVHHNPARALGDLTGIKKHFSRKHGEKKWKCDKCSKKYAVQSDWKAHQKICGTREYKCDCGTIFSRRDSFITHRAFCDALAEENNKVNQGLMNNMGPNSQNQMAPELIPSMPMSNGNASVGVPDFGNLDPSSPLKSLPQELVPMPFMSMDMGGGMFSSSSSSQFGRSRSVSSSSSSLQLSSNSASGLNYSHDGFASSMTCPQQQNKSYDHHFAPQTDQSSMMGISPIMSSAMNDMGMFANMLVNGADHQNQGLMKSMEQEDSDSSSLLQGRTQGPAMFGTNSGGGGSSNMTTLDFMGIGGSRPNGLHEQQHHQQQRLELEAISQQQRLPMMNPFSQQLSHGDPSIEKPLWEV
ncbi:Zinc finger protein NUTCRACKER [Hibiscus syriacus]|uniref:Zinc finger protein NUTCRACKER n=1 Tax=Hibiscus syriacus TaxID=106335 RepID=A0A6A2XAE1_HIBSY|nr:Zinc finger protein NUTCRACKER [Hibiscus syriacus]